VIGGEQVFRDALPRADRLYVTLVLSDVEGDVFFPEIDESAWRLIEQADLPADEKNAVATRFLIYDRKNVYDRKNRDTV